MLKKLLAGVGTVALSLGLVTLVAAPAQAHTGDLNVTAVCNAQTGKYDLTATLTISQTGEDGSTMWKVGTSTFTGTPSSNGGLTNGPVLSHGAQTITLGTFSLPGNTTDKGPWVYAYTMWTPDNYAKGSDGQLLQNLSGTCGDTTDHKITICHATPPENAKNGWNSQSVDYDSIIKQHGHDSHAADIIPPFTYIKNGQSGSYPGKNWNAGGKQIYDNGCAQPGAPPAPSYADPVCVATGQLGTGTVTIPSGVTGAQYSLKSGNGAYAPVAQGATPTFPAGTTVQVKVDPMPGYELSITSQAFAAHTLTGPDVTKCVVPTAPTPDDSVCTGTPGGSTTASFSIPAVNGVRWFVDGVEKTAPYSQDVTTFPTTVTITAQPVAGYIFPANATTSWPLTFNGAGDCRATATPSVSFTDAVCTGPGTSTDPSYTIGAGAGVTYVVTIDGNASSNNTPGTYAVGTSAHVVIDATPNAGYKFADGAQTHFETTFVLKPCLVDADVTPTELDFTDSVCTKPGHSSDGSYVIPESTGVQYQIQRLNGTWKDIAAGSYDVNAIGQTVHIRAVPKAGFTLAPGSTTSWEHTFAWAGHCLREVTPVDPEFTDSECVAPGVSTQGTYLLPNVKGVKYIVFLNGSLVSGTPGVYDTDPGDTVVVIALPKPGYVFPDQLWKWKHTFTDPGECLVSVDPVKPTVTAQVCTVDPETGAGILTNGEVTIEETFGVQYALDNTDVDPGVYPVTPGDHTVTATAWSGFTLSGYDGPWTLTSAFAEPCGDLITHPLVTPAVTSTQQTCTAAGSYTLSNDLGIPSAALWTVNGSPVSAGTFSVTGAATVKVHAEPYAPDYGFADGQQQDWTLSFSAPATCDPGQLRTLALTGTMLPIGWIGAAVLLLLAGLSLVVVQMLRRREER